MAKKPKLFIVSGARIYDFEEPFWWHKQNYLLFSNNYDENRLGSDFRILTSLPSGITKAFLEKDVSGTILRAKITLSLAIYVQN